MRKLSKFLGVTLGFLLIFSFSLGICGEEQGIAKDETIYIELNSNGSVKEVLAVNHIDTPIAGTYTDYGDYATIENITGEEVPIVEGNKITWDLPAYENGFYYIGRFKEAELPWTFGITYLLDSKRVNAQDLVGATGEIKIKITATANNKTPDYFKDNFAMQLSLALNTDVAKDVTAYNATQVLAGKSLTLSYTALPGNDINDTVTFQGDNFEFDGISVIFSPFSMDSYTSLDGLDENVTAMIDAMDALISGTQKLQAGMTQLSDGAGELKDGSQALAEGAESIDDGMTQYQQGLNTFSSYITSFSGEMANSLAALEDAGKNLESAKSALNTSSKKVEDAIANIDSTAQGYTDNIVQLEEALNGLSGGLSDLAQGMEKITEANNSIEGQLKELQGKYGALAQQYANLESDLEGANAGELANSILNNPEESEDAKSLAGSYLALSKSATGTKEAIAQLNSNFEEINSAFAGSIESISQGYSEINGGIEEMQSSVNAIIQSLGNGFDFSTIKSQLSSLQNELDSAAGVLGQFEVDDFNIDVDKYKDGISQMEGAADGLKENFRLLHEGINANLVYGIQELNSGIDILHENLKALPGSVGTINQGQKQLKTGIDQTLDQFTDSEEAPTPVSFAAPTEDITPRTIQFIGTTPGAVKDNVVYEAPQEEEIGLWQRIINLFK